MNIIEKINVLICDNVTLRFPLINPANRWRLLFSDTFRNWHYALNNVTFHLSQGSITGIIGRNGAGKSTLLRTLAGIYEPTTGNVIRLGEVSSLFELGGMGGVFITGKQYVRRWLRLNGVPHKNWNDLIQDVREFSELGDRLDDRLYTYSSGMASRLYFSTATCIKSEIYLIDEILSVGDEHFQSKCWRRVRERLRDGVSGVLVTHDWTAILRLCEHACELREGRIVTDDNSEKVICSYLQSIQPEASSIQAKFLEPYLSSITVHSGENLIFDIPIKIFGSEAVFFEYTIEKLIPGKEWQILFFGGKTFVGNLPGEYIAHNDVQQLPIPKGEYRLNLFLFSARPDNGGPRTVYEMRSWISEDCINLNVLGGDEAGLVTVQVEVDIQ